MCAQFHTPSFGDEEFDLSEVEPLQAMDQASSIKLNAASGQSNTGDDSKRPKDDNAEPVKPVSAYALFFRDTVSAIKAQNPTTSFEDISKIVNSMWQVLDPTHKNVYNKKSELAKKEYIKQMGIYRNSQLRQTTQDETSLNNFNQQNTLQHPNISPKSVQITSKPAVFTISRTASESEAAPQSNIVYCNNVNTSQANPENTSANQQPHHVSVVSNPTSAQICIRENCNKLGVVNPDWEDEYCSNECVVIHCRNVFNQWVKSNMEGQA